MSRPVTRYTRITTQDIYSPWAYRWEGFCVGVMVGSVGLLGAIVLLAGMR